MIIDSLPAYRLQKIYLYVNVHLFPVSMLRCFPVSICFLLSIFTCFKFSPVFNLHLFPNCKNSAFPLGVDAHQLQHPLDQPAPQEDHDQEYEKGAVHCTWFDDDDACCD